MTRPGGSDRWARLEEICLGALNVPAEDRPAWIEKAADGDAALAADARELLACHDPGFLAVPVSRVRTLADGPDPGTPSSERAPDIEGYRLIRPLGRGGMGDVYLASREGGDYRRYVALKVIRRGLDSEEVVARFRRERQILSSLTHPNIAQLLDGGVTRDGSPYFVMEHVEGVDLAEWVSGTAIDLRDRIALFLDVLAAVQHAHRALVIHRDLKPANILVTDERTVKLVDFGIAKLLDADDETGGFRTRADRQMLTPEYAAPEQLDGGSVTTATDVYALGVILYELLTDVLPTGEGETKPGSRRSRLSETPLPPSRATRRPGATSRPGATIDRDLDVITLKALELDPLRRYSSAAAMAEDLRRWLEGRPILARPSTWRYRTRKFIRRRPWAAATAAAASVAILATAALPWVAAHRAAVERDRALEVQGFLMEMFGTTGGDRATGDTLTARGLLDRQAALVDRLYTDDPDMHARMLRVLGDGYDRLGLPADAAPHAEAALALERAHDGLSPDGLAASLNLLGWVRHQEGEPEAATALLEEAVELRRRLGDRYRAGLARSLNDLAVVLDATGDYERSAELHREAFDLRMAEAGLADRATAVSASNLAVSHYRSGDFEGAQEYGAVAVESLRLTLGVDHQRSIIAQNNLAAFRIAAGDLEGAREEYADLVERQTRLQGREHPVTTGLMGSLATVEVLLGDGAAAEALAREIVEIEAHRWGEDDPRSGEALRLLGRAQVLQGNFDEGIGSLRDALARLSGSLGRDHRQVAATEAALAEAYDEAGSASEALVWQRRAARSYERAYGPDHPETRRQRERLITMEEGSTG